ncbi:hypothetical protein DAI22_06g239103 [Oryza sativa Japonica Group]|nr:hypothetical protein DAI22_06g239103 [Oryza sativa Japonica Group]
MGRTSAVILFRPNIYGPHVTRPTLLVSSAHGGHSALAAAAGLRRRRTRAAARLATLPQPLFRRRPRADLHSTPTPRRLRWSSTRPAKGSTTPSAICSTKCRSRPGRSSCSRKRRRPRSLVTYNVVLDVYGWWDGGARGHESSERDPLT